MIKSNDFHALELLFKCKLKSIQASAEILLLTLHYENLEYMPSPECSLLVNFTRKSHWLTTVSKKLENLYDEVRYGPGTDVSDDY